MSVQKENQRTKYFIVSPDETHELNLFKPLPNSQSVVSRLCDILNLKEPDLDKVEYNTGSIQTRYESCRTRHFIFNL